MHLRRQIREGIGTAVTGLATTGTRVFQSRVYPLESTDLPGICIYTRREVSQPITIHPSREIERQVFVEVEGVARASADIDDALDQIASEVETALAWPCTALLAIAKDVSLRATNFEMAPGDKPVGLVRLTYQVDYFNLENAPDVAT